MRPVGAQRGVDTGFRGIATTHVSVPTPLKQSQCRHQCKAVQLGNGSHLMRIDIKISLGRILSTAARFLNCPFDLACQTQDPFDIVDCTVIKLSQVQTEEPGS